MAYSYAPSAPNYTRSQGILIHVPACILKSFPSALKFQLRDRPLHSPMNHVSVKPCQMLAYGGACAEGDDVCSQPDLGSLRVHGRFSITGVQACKYQRFNVCRQILAENKTVKKQNRDNFFLLHRPDGSFSRN